ncbi:unnamed protein product, partial [Didymodactylos carnosus]
MARDGPRCLFVGFHATLWRDSPTYGIYMITYEFCKRSIDKHTKNEFLASFVAGGISGVVAWTIAMPVDTVKSKQQAGHTKLGLVPCLSEIYHKSGAYALYCGWTATASRAFILNAVSLLVWDQ